MNVFYLSHNPTKCAKWYFNSHISKMLIESVQMMSTTLWFTDPLIAEYLYKNQKCYAPISNVNHKSAVWVRSSLSHFIWLRNLIICLNEEKKYRFNTGDHKSYFVGINLPFPCIENIKFSQPPQAMPEYLQNKDSIVAYRNYYMSDEKNHIAKWTNRNKPEWWK